MFDEEIGVKEFFRILSKQTDLFINVTSKRSNKSIYKKQRLNLLGFKKDEIKIILEK